jgi:general secretion pathway protein F
MSGMSAVSGGNHSDVRQHEYVCRITTRDNRVIEQIVPAKTEREAKSIASRFGKVISVRKQNPLFKVFRQRLKPRERIILMQRLAMMLKSKVPVMEALDILYDSFSGVSRRVIQEIKTKTDATADLIRTIESMTYDFPAATIALIKAGAESGETHSALLDAAEFEKEMLEAKDGNKVAIFIAVMYYLIGMVAVIAIELWGIPYMKGLSFMKMVPTEKMELVYDISHYAFVIVIIMAVITVLIFAILLLRPVLPVVSDGLILKIPMIRDIIMSQRYYVTFYSLSRMLASGVRLDDAFRISIRNTPSGVIRSDLENALKAIIAGRLDWGKEMKHIDAADRAAILTAQNIDDVTESMRNVAKGKRDMYLYKISIFTPTLSAIGFITLMIAGVVIFAVSTIPMMEGMLNIL